jgi:protein TonB
MAFNAGVREGQPELPSAREPETSVFGKVTASVDTEIDPLDQPETPFDPFAENNAAVPIDRQPSPLSESDRPPSRPAEARELLPRGLPGGSGDVSEGVLSDGSDAPRAPGTGAGPSGSGTGSGGSGDGSLVAVFRPKPEYPLAARRKHVEGVSVVEITIDAGGSVATAAVIESSGAEALDQAALETAKKWKYEPRSDALAPGPVKEKIRFVFRLTD